MHSLKYFESLIKIRFKKKEFIRKILTHKSYDAFENNEKLEFLGDRVLGLIISKKLLELYPNESEGDLDKRFAFLVNKKTCLKIGKKLKLEKFIIVGKSYKAKTSVEDKILSDACEALIGGIYLDSGFFITEKFVLDNWKDEIKKTNITEIDSKTKLQEYTLKKYKRLPIYKILKSTGPKHNPLYKVGVKIKNSKVHIGNGKSIKNAEQNAAESLTAFLGL